MGKQKHKVEIKEIKNEAYRDWDGRKAQEERGNIFIWLIPLCMAETIHYAKKETIILQFKNMRL